MLAWYPYVKRKAHNLTPIIPPRDYMPGIIGGTWCQNTAFCE